MKRYFVLLPWVLILLLASACSGGGELFSFPLSQEDLEQALEAKKLQWQVVDDRPQSADSVTYTLKNDDGGKCFITTWGTDTFRGLQLTLPTSGLDNKKEYYMNELPQLVNFVGELFGNGKEANKVYKEFSRSAHTRDWDLRWPKRVGTTHYSFGFRSSIAANITIRNNELYQQYLLSTVEGMSQERERMGTPVQNANVADVLAAMPGGGVDQHYVVRGHLENICKATTSPNPDLHPDDFLCASLVDGSGSMEVFITSSSLTFKELSQERDHYLTLYQTENPHCIIHVSAPIN